MLIVALVLAVISLAALVTAVVTSNEMIAWACIGFSALGVLLLIVDAIRDRNRRAASDALAFDRSEALATETTEVMAPVIVGSAIDRPLDDVDVDDSDAEGDEEIVDYPAEVVVEDETVVADDLEDEVAAEDFPDEVVYDDPDHDLPSDDEPDYPIAAEEAAIHTISESELETVPDETSYMVSESPTVSYAGSAEDSAIVIYSSETETETTAFEDSAQSEDSEEPGGER